MDRRDFSLQKSLTAIVGVVGVIGLIIACGDTHVGAGGDQTTVHPPTGSCATPNVGCPCDTPGAKTVCGKKITGDLSFIYCYEGTRLCGEDGRWGDCGDGTVKTRSLAGGLHTSALGTTPSQCTAGLLSDTITVCTGGMNLGELCTTNADCPAGEKKCKKGDSDDQSDCRNGETCITDCEKRKGHCTGGPRNNGCDSDMDCTAPGVCTISAGGYLCGTYNGACASSDPVLDGEACNSNADCGPGGLCNKTKFGVCIGGKHNGEKCENGEKCKSSKGTSGVCSNQPLPGDSGLPPIDPCDPYCTVYSDTPDGIDAGLGLRVVDGGLTGLGCGDGILLAPEACDDGNTTAGDGCDSSCKLEAGFQCPTPGSPCIPSTCGNGIKEGLEECDDGPWVADGTGVVKDRPFDGCYKCELELNCPVGAGPGPTACSSVCGDGIVMAGEACDDGNLTNNDGCSSTCTIEPGATCVNSAAALPAYLDVPVIYRDFKTFGGPNGNPTPAPDFQFSGGGLLDSIPHKPGGTGGGCVAGVSQGIPNVSLNTVDRAPDLLAAKTCILDAASFSTWYRDAPNTKTILGKFLRLGAVAPVGTYRFDTTGDPAYNLPDINCGNATPTTTCASKSGFFPIDGVGYGNETNGHNYSFTSEVRFPFTYAGGEVLKFVGDDDMWVWIGGRKVVDIGNPHTPATGQVTLALAGSISVPASATAVPPITLTVGSTYEISVFHAERNSTGSNYTLTLSGFNRTVSTCTVPVPPSVFVRDYQAVCSAGSRPVWSVFQWKGSVVGAATVQFRAATADTQALLPTSKIDPTSVAIGTATTANTSPLTWGFDGAPGTAIPVSADLKANGNQESKSWLRVWMTFSPGATLDEWAMLYDCLPSE